MTKRSRSEEHACFASLYQIKYDPLGLIQRKSILKHKPDAHRSALDLSHSCSFSRDDFIAIGLEMGSTLLNLDMSHNYNITDNDVYAALGLPSCLPLPLRSLNLSFTRITDSCIESIAMYAPGLKVVKINGCENLTDASLSALARYCKDLTTIKMSECTLVSDRGIQLLAQECGASLRSIHFGKCVQVTDKAVPYLAQFCPSLMKVDLSYTSISATGLKQLLSSLFLLTRLRVEGLALGSFHIEQIVTKPFLAKINVSFCHLLTQGDVEKMVQAKQLQEVLIFGLNELNLEGSRKFVF
eukprot:TRINITY_DN1432_c0_g1_i1.p1 TRINITY_DN1432_c0_g1~~TRINITY_DN1432_c0_g1_i1.p1  ORF type:complete len:298 (-),score=44.35 TRINITY_DN1432_c0_g1_i1:24-917(-)